MNQFFKQIHALLTTTKVITEEIAVLYRDQVFRFYELPKKIIHERGL